MILFIVSFVAGFLTVLAPCVLPLLPVIVGGSISGGKSIRRALTVTTSLTISVITFTLLIKASTLLIDIPQDFWKWFSGGVITAFGFITLFPNLWDMIPNMSKISTGSNKVLASGYQKQSLFGDVLVGAALGPVFSTCSPTYFLVLAAVLPENFALGILYLVAYSVGLSLALLILAFVGQKIVDIAGIAANPNGWFKKTLGVLFIIVGIGIVTGADKALQTDILNAGFFDVTKVEEKLLNLVPNAGSEETKQQMDQAKKDMEYKKAPEIKSPDGFINTDGKPITLAELRGKVVLLDFWTYSCINCQRTLPYLNEWYAKYKDQGLEIVSIHTPEFAFEHIKANVEDAVARFDIKYPVVLDNEYATWNAYNNRYWPRKYLIDPDGYIIYDHIGEGGYAETEEAIKEALAKRNNTKVSDDKNTSAEKMQNITVGSPETYFGAARNEYLANGRIGVAGTQTFSLPENILANRLYLGGAWDIQNEFAQNTGTASIVFKYAAKNMYFVAGSDKGISADIYQDNKFVKSIDIQAEKLYTLAENPSYGEHTMRIEIKEPGLRAFTFTFG